MKKCFYILLFFVLATSSINYCSTKKDMIETNQSYTQKLLKETALFTGSSLLQATKLISIFLGTIGYLKIVHGIVTNKEFFLEQYTAKDDIRGIMLLISYYVIASKLETLFNK